MEQTEHYDVSLTGEDRYRLLLDSVFDYAIYMLDADGVVTSWNAGAQRFKGYTAAEILGQHFSRFYTEEDRSQGRPQQALETAAREGRFENEAWRVRKDGTRFWAHVIIDPIRDPGGRLIGYAKVTRDVTERKLAQDALRETENQFRRLVQSVTDYAIYTIDRNGRVVSWNAGAQRIKGYQAEEIVGQHFSRFYTEEDRRAGEADRALATAEREGRYEKEGWRVRKDGSRFWAHVILDPIRDDDGALLGFAKITRDVTERVDSQRALLQAQEALFQSQKMDAIGQLTGGVAHDFNNLLMAVLGSLELLRKRLPDEPRINRLLDNAIQGAQRGAALTQRMLAFARRQDLNPAAVDVPALVRGMTDLLQRSLGPEIAIQTRFPPKLAAVSVDANQLELALLNLAVNARDAMPQGGTLTIAAREESVLPGQNSKLAPGRYVCLSVTDNGEGMDEETLERAREPFFTTKGAGKGTGLGLSMVHGLAEQSGGRLVLESRRGDGTVAALWLPEARPDADLSSLARLPDPEAGEAERALRVLAVDDDGLVLMNTAAMLEDLGHTVFEASSGKQALEILRRDEAIDLVVTDQAMPYMTGAQLLAEIRANWPELRVILATGYAELPPGTDTDASRLAKPFRQEDLRRAILGAMRDTAAQSGAG
jgi:PAS domain S-box-containing protein